MSAAARTADHPADPIAAVTHRDPYPYYADLVAARPIHRDDSLGLWVVCSAAAVTAVLDSPACLVRPPAEPVPRVLLGSPGGSIFGRLVRMNEGASHSTMKPAVSLSMLVTFTSTELKPLYRASPLTAAVVTIE